jgi:hypothetical protein
MTTTVTITVEQPSEKTYKIGDFFLVTHSNIGTPELYILANTNYESVSLISVKSVSLISVETGERLLNPISVKHYGEITQDELKDMIPGKWNITHVDKLHLVKNL